MGEDVRCPECGAEAGPNESFCSSCGSPLAALTASPDAPVVEYMRTEPRLFGVLPPMLTTAIAIALLAFGVAALAVGTWAIGAILLAFATPFTLAAIAVLSSNPANPVVRVVAATPSRIRGYTGYAGVSVGAWTGAGRELLRLRVDLRRLRAERQRVQLALGEAAYREQKKEIAELRSGLRELDAAITERERQIVAAKRRARRTVERRRLELRPTRELR